MTYITPRPMRTPEGKAELWRKYVVTRSTEDRNALAEVYYPLVVRIARTLQAKLPPSIDLGDLISWGSFGLLSSIPLFDPSRGKKFGSFANFRIRGAMLDALRNAGPAPRLLRVKYARLQAATDVFHAENGRPPTIDELAVRLQTSPAIIHEVQREAALYVPVSLGEELRDDHDGTVTTPVAQCRAADPYDAAARADTRREILEHLTPREAELLNSYHFCGITYHEAGKRLGMKPATASVTADRARQKIAMRLGYKGARELLCA